MAVAVSETAQLLGNIKTASTEVAVLFEGTGELEDARVLIVAARDLKADWEAFGRDTCGHGSSGVARLSAPSQSQSQDRVHSTPFHHMRRACGIWELPRSPGTSLCFPSRRRLTSFQQEAPAFGRSIVLAGRDCDLEQTEQAPDEWIHPTCRRCDSYGV